MWEETGRYKDGRKYIINYYHFFYLDLSMIVPVTSHSCCSDHTRFPLASMARRTEEGAEEGGEHDAVEHQDGHIASRHHCVSTISRPDSISNYPPCHHKTLLI